MHLGASKDDFASSRSSVTVLSMVSAATWRCTPDATEAAMIFPSKDHQPRLWLTDYQSLFELNEYGQPGSQLAREEAYYFSEFLADVFDGCVESKHDDLMPGAVLPPPVLLTSTDVLIWFTGATLPLPGGFKRKLSIHFDKSIRLSNVIMCNVCQFVLGHHSQGHLMFQEALC